MKHILVPIDFSDDSLNALSYAIMIANTKNYNVRLIHVIRKHADYNALFNPDDFNEVIKSGIEENFENVINTYQKTLNQKFDYRIRVGRVYGEICNQAQYADAEMIIMGTHGVKGFEERWRGSNAYRVVSNASCPVLTVHYNFSKRPIKKIVLPIDITEETRLKVPYLVNLAKQNRAQLHVVDVRESNRISTRKLLNDYISQVISFLKSHNINCIRESLKGSNIADAIIEYALFNDADIIGCVRKSTDLTRQFWMPDYAQQLVNHSPIPVFSINSKLNN